MCTRMISPMEPKAKLPVLDVLLLCINQENQRKQTSNAAMVFVCFFICFGIKQTKRL